MADLPTEIGAYLHQLASLRRRPAWMLIDSEGRLVRAGGDLTAYGLHDLTPGKPVAEQIFFLEGIFPLDSERLILPALQTDSGLPADIHLLQTGNGDYALFLDATDQVLKQGLMQQKGNELSLSYQRLLKEIQKKEVLLHCIVHDLAGPLMGIKGGFELLSSEPISDKGRKFLEIGLRQATRQETLIREILQAFSAELESFESFHEDPEKAPDALDAAEEVLEALLPAFDLNQVKLRIDADSKSSWKVVGEKSRLERVISNLAENALRHSSAGSTVTIRMIDEGDKIMVAIDDEGPGIPPELADALFQKFAQGKKGRGKIGLGLYFCRITVEHWGGEIGHHPRDEGGTRFWFRLPKPYISEPELSQI
ncbi:MAG: HAMP domain-containing histidine kinase [Acidobacteriota bacterium]|nr:MAG: HAMP domain-containing histidine kinase [Acidobacteriota bacterium]